MGILAAMSRREVLVHNARIWTGVPARGGVLRADSMRIVDGRIAELDPAAAGNPASRIDANGRFIVPGFIDAHLHLLMGGASLAQLDLRGIRSRAAFEGAIAARNA